MLKQRIMRNLSNGNVHGLISKRSNNVYGRRRSFRDLVRRKSIQQNRKSQGGAEEGHGILEGISSLHSWIKSQTMIRPNKIVKKKPEDNYDDEDDDDVVISLTAKDPQASKGIVRFDFTHGEYLPIKLSEWMIDHMEIESRIIHRESEEGKEQLQKGHEVKELDIENVDIPKPPKSAKKGSANKKGKGRGKNDDTEGEEEEEESEDSKKKKKKAQKRKDSVGSEGSDGGDTKLTNQFSFVERATQTMNNALKHTEMQTAPPPRANFSETVNQWIIYDSYVSYEAAKEAAEEKEQKKEMKEVKPIRRRLLETTKENGNNEINKKMVRAAKILERMVNQNTFDDIAQDFKFYEDNADEFKDNEGTLLPLWKFEYEKAKNLEITSLCWNPTYNDLFVAAYGSYNFYSQAEPGVVCVFSLKNPSFPEYLCHAPCGVMSIDVHPAHPHMIVAGLYDGNIAVYNLQKNKGTPCYMSEAQNGKHKDVVWQVKWANDNLDGYLNFYSISGDGRVTNWTLVKTALWFNDILVINFSKTLQNLGEESVPGILRDHSANEGALTFVSEPKLGHSAFHYPRLDSGRTIAFKPDDESTFLVGTDEGLVYLCTTQYSSRYLNTFAAHNTPVYNIKWNTFIPNIFITCAAEWIVKIWHKGSTVHIYDLYINKYNPICVQAVVPKKRARLNHISFNQSHPIIIVGDSRGFVQSLKLSPNLRKQSEEVKSALRHKDLKKAGEMEIKKLEQLLSQVRVPERDSDIEEE